MDIVQKNTYDLVCDKPIEYFRKPNILMMLKVISTQAQIMQDTIYKLRFDRILDNAYGDLLDIIGEIVGETRQINVDIWDGVFTFHGNPYGAGFDIGRFSDLSLRPTGSVVRDDTIYRLAIKARIMINYGSGTPEDIIDICRLLTNSNTVGYEEEKCTVSLTIDTETNPLLITYAHKSIQKALPVGVRLTGITIPLYWDDGDYDDCVWCSPSPLSKFDAAYWDRSGWN